MQEVGGGAEPRLLGLCRCRHTPHTPSSCAHQVHTHVCLHRRCLMTAYSYYASILVCQHTPKRAYDGDLNEHALYVFAQAQKEESSVWGGGSEVACPRLAPSIAEVCVGPCRSCKHRAFLVARFLVAPPNIFPCRTFRNPSPPNIPHVSNIPHLSSHPPPPIKNDFMIIISYIYISRIWFAGSCI
jgi:hypothetical protein